MILLAMSKRLVLGSGQGVRPFDTSSTVVANYLRTGWFGGTDARARTGQAPQISVIYQILFLSSGNPTYGISGATQRSSE
jgi:hypothetical protein